MLGQGMGWAYGAYGSLRVGATKTLLRLRVFLHGGLGLVCVCYPQEVADAQVCCRHGRVMNLRFRCAWF
jgi:hypothetical protein